MVEESPKTIIVGTSDVPMAPLILGSKLFHGACGHNVWLSPVTQSEKNDEDILMCQECVKGKIMISNFQGVSEDRLDELEAQLGYRPTQMEIFLLMVENLGGRQ